MYGPTEATVWASCQKIEKDTDKILIGKPLANYEFYILDENKRETPFGEKGTLFIAGDSVTKGYLDRPKLNQEKYINIDGKTLYETGDLAKFHNDGSVELFGRNDYQVKIRGYRIELGEIESEIRDVEGNFRVYCKGL